MINATTFLYTILLGSICSSSTAQIQWLQQAGTGGMGNGICSDLAGNIIVTGIVNSNALFGTDTVSAHFADPFLAKYDPNGDLLWVRTGGDDLIDISKDVACDDAGYIHITGSYTTNMLHPAVEFDGQIVNGFGSTDIFVAKYDPDGTLLWIRNAGGSLADQGTGIEIAPNGNIVVCGFFQGTATFGDFTMTSAGSSDLILLEYDTDGEVVWASQCGGPGEDQTGKLAILPGGDIAIGGKFQQTATFGNTALTASGLSDIFIARFDGSGNAVWAKRSGSTIQFASDMAYDIDAAPNGDIIVCGEIAGEAQFGTINVPTNGGLDVFIARYNGEGDPMWVHHGGGPQQDHGYGVAVDAEGNAYLAGQADDGSMTYFDGILLDPFGNESVFLAKYDPSGQVQWVRRYAPGTGTAVAVVEGGCLYFTGAASGILGQPFFDDEIWQYNDRPIFTAQFCDGIATGEPPPMNTDLAVHPNPANDLLYVRGGADAGAEVLVFSASGQLCLRSPLSASGILNVSSLPPGLYQLVLPTDHQRIVKHVMIEHER